MDTLSLDVAARIGALPTFELVDGYDRRKVPQVKRFRAITLGEIKAINYGQEFWFRSNDGKARQLRVASQIKTWKRDPNRFECSFKFGLYESVRWNTREMLDSLLVEVGANVA